LGVAFICFKTPNIFFFGTIAKKVTTTISLFFDTSLDIHTFLSSKTSFTIISQIRAKHDFCRQCQTCSAIANEGGEGIWIYRDRGETLKVEEVRTMIDKINLKQDQPYKHLVSLGCAVIRLSDYKEK